MLKLDYNSHILPFEFPFGISKGLKTEQATLIVSLGLGKLKGYGEATEIAYYNAYVADMIALLDKHKPNIERYALNGPERFWHFLHHLVSGQNFLISALDCAGWDLWAQLNRKPLYSLIGLQWKNAPLTSYTLGIMSPDEAEERIQKKDYSIYKVKMGGDFDLEVLQRIRKLTNAEIRIDVNEGWSIERAMELVPELEDLGITLIEQPLKADDWDGLRKLKQKTNIPIIADEACKEEKDIAKCLEEYDGINIKLSKCGGITPAINMIRAIKKAKKKLMLGGMCETNVGATLLAHLLPLADYADIDGPLLLSANIGKGLIYDKNQISLPIIPGSGIIT